jgi:dihydroneopterin aldolase
MIGIRSGYIYINSLRIHALHGVLKQERMVGNDYELTLRAKYDISDACATDDINKALNYAAVCDEVRQVMTEPCALVERVAYKIGERIMKKCPQVEEIDLTLTKKNPPMGADCDGAGVEIHLINNKTD